MELILILGYIGILHLIANLLSYIRHIFDHRITGKTSIGKDIKTYQKKDIMTPCEYNFYNKIKELENNYKIIPQLNLAAVTNKLSNDKYCTELFRNIDFAIFTYDYKKLLLLIELNDSSHERKDRKSRDTKVQNICNTINVPLIKFYTKYSNEKSYVINRILKEIEKRPNTK